MVQRVPLMLIPLGVSKRISRPFRGIAVKIAKIVPGVEYDLRETDLEADLGEYSSSSLLNSLFIGIILFALIFILSFKVKLNTLNYSLFLAFSISIIFSLLFLILLLRYPKITAGKKAEQIDRSLVFALKDLLLQISAGVSLPNALINIGNAEYGEVSREFDKAAKSINAGGPIDRALEKMALASKSDYMRRSVWQIVNTLKAGASLKGALRTIIDDLNADQKTKIRDYAHELNLWSLIYMLFAVAVPTIGATMLVILSSFGGMGITKGTFLLFVAICLVVQVILIGFVKTRRPIVTI